MEVEKFHNLSSANWRIRKIGGCNSVQVQSLSVPERILRPDTGEHVAWGQEKLDFQLWEQILPSSFS